MIKRVVVRAGGLLSIAAAGVVIGCGGTAPLQSGFRQNTIEIDGSEQDWYDNLRPIEKEPASLGVVNDEEHLYVAFLTADEALIRRIMAAGLVIWLDPAGGKRKELGIQYPLGMMDRGRSGGTIHAPMDRDRMRDPEARREMFEATLHELALLRGEEGEGMRMSVSSLPGLSVQVSFESGILFYEMQLPLKERGPFVVAAGVDPGEVLGIGIETGEIDREAMRRQMAERSASQMGGMSPGMGAGMGGGHAQMPASGRAMMVEPFRVWRRVALAE